jgi:hypothetical protein
MRNNKTGKKRNQRVKTLTRRESALLEGVRVGKSISDAARGAGYSMKWPGQAGSQAFKNIQRKMPKILDELGLTYAAVLKRIEASENI